MSSAIFIVLDKVEPGLDAFVNGKTLARHFEALEALAEQLGVRPLSDFVRIDFDEVAAVLEDETLDRSFPPQECPDAADLYDPEEGLTSVRALLGYLREEPTEEAQGICMDLMEFEEVLKRAAAVSATFCLNWDY